MSDVRQSALTYLATHQVMTLATTGPSGVWAAAVFYVNEGFALFFLSAGHTRHAQNIQARPQVAATVQEDYQGWQEIQGIQLEGGVERLEGEARAAAVALYGQKYPFIVRAAPPIQAALAQVNWYRLKPERLYFIDNRKGFGQRDEVEPL